MTYQKNSIQQSVNSTNIADLLERILDKGIVIEREKVKDYSRSALLGGKKKVDMEIQITVKNKKGIDDYFKN